MIIYNTIVDVYKKSEITGDTRLEKRMMYKHSNDAIEYKKAIEETSEGMQFVIINQDNCSKINWNDGETIKFLVS